MSTGLLIAIICSFIALIYGAWSYKWILSKPAGNERMQEISSAIQEGARAYLNRWQTLWSRGITHQELLELEK